MQNIRDFFNITSTDVPKKSEPLADFLFPILGNKGGYGTVVGTRLYTAAHILGSTNYIRTKRGDVHYLDEKNAVFISDQRDEKLPYYNDLAVFQLNSMMSPIGVFTNKCKVGMSVELLHVEEGQYPYPERLKGTIIKTAKELGNENFIECQFDKMLTTGDSGSPLFIDNTIVGVLTGDLEGKEYSRTIVFQLVSQF